MTKHGRLMKRRTFLGAATAAITGPMLIPARALGQGQPAPSERIHMGLIGAGAQGTGVMRAFLSIPEVRIVAVCDVDREHYRDQPWGEGPKYGLTAARDTVAEHYADKEDDAAGAPSTYTDFRELCAHPDLDAVIVGTPDHWHALCALEAIKRGKDVYCEKPVTHRFREGQVLYREFAKRKAIFQTGSQQRSSWEFRHAVELVRNGHIGAVQRVEVGLPPGYEACMGDTTVQAPPEHLDYDFWCGPSPKLPYMRARHHRWWRGHTAYGGGCLMDWIGHHNDIAHWGIDMDTRGPVEVEAAGWTYLDTDIYDTPRQYEIRCTYPGGITSTISSANRQGVKFIGEDGWVFVCRDHLEASDPRWVARNFDPGPVKVYNSPWHPQNFLDGIKTRKPCIAPAETAHRSVTPGHLGFVSHALGRALKWDPEREVVSGDDEADRLLKRIDYRAPWSFEH